MGYGSYSVSSRATRSSALGYTTKSFDTIFTQQRSRQIHKLMNPKDVVYRECCDSKDHPEVIPTLLFLDSTGSMGSIPHDLIKNGLPKLMGGLTQHGLDVSLLFGAVGDHECDDYPLQVGQFESGDKELDEWLTRTYIEGGGGGNNGESYLLAWYFALNHVQTDAWNKRNKKGFLFTVGDEPNLDSMDASDVKGIMGTTAVTQNLSASKLLVEVQKYYHVYHMHISHGYRSTYGVDQWKKTLGENCITVDDHTKLAEIIRDTIKNKEEKTDMSISVSVDDYDINVDEPIAVPVSDDSSVKPNKPPVNLDDVDHLI